MKKIIIGNLKMNLLTLAERDRYLESFVSEMHIKKNLNSEIVLCPPNIHLEKFIEKFKDNNILVGTQNIFQEERGSFTGEVSAPMMKNLGVKFVVVGHSERRKYFGETNKIANEKIKAALKNNLIPIYCIGETQEERNAGRIGEILFAQIIEGLNEISVMNAPKIILAYEPVWAVGSDKIPSSDDILGVKILIKKILSKIYSLGILEKIKIVYGGSVKANTAIQVCVEPGMDGVLVGRESLIPSEFIKIAEIIDKS
jgi:triosephosphate isomerase